MLFPCHIMRGLVGHSKEFEFHGKNRKTLIKYNHNRMQPVTKESNNFHISF